jgi:hypothetical protein
MWKEGTIAACLIAFTDLEPSDNFYHSFFKLSIPKKNYAPSIVLLQSWPAIYALNIATEFSIPHGRRQARQPR